MFHVKQSCQARSASSGFRSEEHTSELQSQSNLVCRLLLEKKTEWSPIRSFIIFRRTGKRSSHSAAWSVMDSIGSTNCAYGSRRPRTPVWYENVPHAFRPS